MKPVTQAILQRQSTRGFLDKPVPGALVRELLEVASHAPSGGNLQPWRVHAVGGQALTDFIALMAVKLNAGEQESAEYPVYPVGLWEPLRTRRRRAGDQRYAALGATPAQDGMAVLSARNYRFFGAPVGLFFFLDRRVGASQWADLGMFLQSLMLAATDHGLATCPQAAWSNWPQTVRTLCHVGDDWVLFAGMSLGYADRGEPLNGYRTERAPLESFATFAGIDD